MEEKNTVEGLETVAWRDVNGKLYRRIDVRPGNGEPLVSQDQAEAIIAAKDERIAELEDENYELKTGPWPEWANAVLKVIRERSGYDGYDDTSEGVDLPVELEECMVELESDNAALTARVKDYEDAIKAKGGNEHSPTQDAYELACKAIEKHRDRAEALETQLAAAKNALEGIAGYTDQGHEKWRQDHSDLSKLIGHPGVFSDSHKINVLCQFARAALEAKP